MMMKSIIVGFSKCLLPLLAAVRRLQECCEEYFQHCQRMFTYYKRRKVVISFKLHALYTITIKLRNHYHQTSSHIQYTFRYMSCTFIVYPNTNITISIHATRSQRVIIYAMFITTE